MRLRVRVEGLERLKAAIEDIKEGIANQEAIDKLSNGLKERLIERAADGIDAAGERFKPYAARGGDGTGKRQEIVTLRRSGAMLDAIQVYGLPDAGIGFKAAKEAEKAGYHQNSGVGKERTKRRFFAVGDADMAWVKKVLSDHAQETITKAFAR
ncbi:MAG: hypothetical protein A3J24_08315 [Deltaproteobacteria bacterium RIFCSPLOWO2_02_FULL_53_8]|nr:MAG: hypothetical protein A3J24_08315 [Deltaproteobacteria bacterium RIFCSPLOWO2_02_FULL_53_8]